MRGSPLLRASLVIAVLMLAFIPLWKLTHATQAAMPASNPLPESESVQMEITLSGPASGFQVLHLGKIIWEEKSPKETALKNLELHFPKEGVDLEVRVTALDPGSNVAVRLSVKPDGREAMEKTAWGRGAVEEVLTFKEEN